MESHFPAGPAGLLVFLLILAVFGCGVAFILFSRGIAGEYRPPPGVRRWIGEGIFRLDDYTARGRANIVKSGICLALLFLAMPMVFVMAESLLPTPERRSGPPIPPGTLSLAAVAIGQMTALMAWLALTLLSAVQFLLAQRHAVVPWFGAAWRRLFDSSAFDAEGQALRRNAMWLLLGGGVLAFGVMVGLHMLLRNMPPFPK
jgi:hypothetical protein